MAETARSSLIDDANKFPIESLFDRMQKLIIGLLKRPEGHEEMFKFGGVGEESKLTKRKQSFKDDEVEQVDTEGRVVVNDLM